MSGLNPRLRQRVETVTVRASVKAGTSNAELFEAWKQVVKVAPGTLQGYGSSIGEALRFFTEEDGAEIPSGSGRRRTCGGGSTTWRPITAGTSSRST